MGRLVVPQGEFTLARYPVRPNETRRAWDAADEYLLRAVADPSTRGDHERRVVIVNDGSGALSVTLAGDRPSMISDSYLSHLAARHNLAANGIAPTEVSLLGSFDPLPDRIDLLLIRVPESLALLDDQLRRLRPHLHADSVVIGAAMVKHLHTSTLERFEHRIGPTSTSLAVKKARLVFSAVGPEGIGSDESDRWPTTYRVDPGDHVVTSHAGIFSAERLDVGTRFLLEHLPPGVGDELVVDLGCGNGVVGMMAAVANPDAEVTFVDESYRAVASAEATFRANLGPDRAADFVVGNGLAEPAAGEPIAAGSIDRVLNNPPFHIDRAVGDAVAWQMFSESRAALRRGGELWVVGNRHLAYHAKLKRLLGNCDVMASSAKFVLLRAVRG